MEPGRCSSDLDSHRKAVFIVSFMNRAGAQQAAHRIACGLKERGWNTELWFLYKVTADSFPGVSVRVFHESAAPGVRGYARILRDVLAAMFSCRPDAAVSFLPLASVIGQTAALLARVPRRVASLRSPASTFNWPIRYLDRLCGTIGIYTNIIAVSHAVAADAKTCPARYRRIIDVVRNGVLPANVQQTTAEARAALGLKRDSMVVLTVGRMAAQKNYPLLLDITERLQHAHLVCVGEGPERRFIEGEITRRKLSDKITLLGALPANRVPLAYRAADIFILPSLFEGQSNALLEAMSASLPVIVSDVPSQTETVLEEGGPWGVALPVNDAQLWADEIDRFATDTARRKHFGALAKQRADRFTIASQIDGFEAALRGTVPPDRPSPVFHPESR